MINVKYFLKVLNQQKSHFNALHFIGRIYFNGNYDLDLDIVVFYC